MTVKAQPETMSYQAEANQILHLMTHSLYSNKEIFMRELISNASDAADKLRFAAISDDALYEGDPDLRIWVTFDQEKNVITLRDNGIGMSREEAIANLGTIAKSGTKEFLENLTGDDAKDSNLIGKFGVGFYSAFVVADKVIVNTRRAGMKSDQGVRWESEGKGEFTINNIDLPKRGTEVILHMKPDEKEFVAEWQIKNIVKKYSNHIPIPIIMIKEEEVELEGEENKDKPKKTKMVEETINQAKALWTRSKSEIKDEEYNELYKHVSHDFQDPLTWAHNRVEGKLEYISLLYLPSKAPFDMWNREAKHGLKLYIQRVFVMDDAEQMLPLYLRFVKGIVDSNDLPLNISRELLQSSKVMDSIRSGCVKRVLDMLENLVRKNPEKYTEFWNEFGQALKEGPGEDMVNRDRIAKLLRFASTHADTDQQNVSLEDYIARMKADQNKIYYVIADSFVAAKNSPHLEIFRKKGIEVLLLSDRVDEWLVAHLPEFEGKQFQSVNKGDLDLGKLEDEKEKEEEKVTEKEFESVIKQMKEVLGDNVKDVRITHRLTDSPACLVNDEMEMSSHLQRLMQAAGQEVPMVKPILEINPDHPITLRLKAEQDDKQFSEWSHVLFDQSLLAEGGQLKDPAKFVKRMNKLLLD